MLTQKVLKTPFFKLLPQDYISSRIEHTWIWSFCKSSTHGETLDNVWTLKTNAVQVLDSGSFHTQKTKELGSLKKKSPVKTVTVLVVEWVMERVGRMEGEQGGGFSHEQRTWLDGSGHTSHEGTHGKYANCAACAKKKVHTVTLLVLHHNFQLCIGNVCFFFTPPRKQGEEPRVCPRKHRTSCPHSASQTKQPHTYAQTLPHTEMENLTL